MEVSPPPVSEPRVAQAHEAALRDLIATAEWAAREETRVAQRHAEVSNDVEVEFLRTTKKLAARRQRVEAETEAEHVRRLSELRTAFDRESRKLDNEAARIREQLGDEAARELNAGSQELEHAVWAAESIYDAEKSQLNHQYADVDEKARTYNVGLEKMLRQAGILAKRYKQEELLVPPDPDAPPPADPRAAEEAMKEEWAKVESGLKRLRMLGLPPWFQGFQAHVAAFVVWAIITFAAIFYTQTYTQAWMPDIISGSISLGAALLLVLLVLVLGRVSYNQVRRTFIPLWDAGLAARAASDRLVAEAAAYRKDRLAERKFVRDEAIRVAKHKIEPVLAEMSRRAGLRQAEVADREKGQRDLLASRRDAALQEADALKAARLEGTARRYARRTELATERRADRLAEGEAEAAAARQEIQQRWTRAWSDVEHLADRTRQTVGDLYPVWTDTAWQKWTPPLENPPAIPFGSVTVDAARVINGHLPGALPSPGEPVAMPALIDMPAAGSILWQYDRLGRDGAIASMQAVVARLLTALPAGSVRLTIIDPIGLGQNFAGFMHLVDYQEELVGARIWTGADQIEQRLTDLTDHMENVIQKYLRNEYQTIDQYNERAGELAEPYRFLVITDFPANFTEASVARLRSILASGPRCGVFTLITCNRSQLGAASGVHLDIADIADHAINLVYENGRYVWKHQVFERFDLQLDPPPSEEQLTELMHKLGRAAREGNRVEVPFEQIAPAAERTWSENSAKVLHVPIGKTGATRLQELVLGKDVAQHALIAGKTGSGKSTLLHVMVTNLALWYSPDEVEFYLIDFKKGVEFKAYATHALPHARAVAVESDREFGLSVLQRLDAEITRRGDLYRQKGVQDLAAYRKAEPGARMPRVLLMIDEFQEFFSEDDKIAQDAALLLDRLVRQGRAFGVHVILGSQTLAGSSNLPRSTIGNMAVRIALQCSDADSQLILSDNNTAARLLSRPGEAIYNDAGGLIDGNSPFQVSWLSDAQRDAALRLVSERAKQLKLPKREQIVFEGNVPAALASNSRVVEGLFADEWPTPSLTTTLHLGGAVAIKEATSAVLRRQSGANVIVIGQQDEGAMGLTVASILGVAAQHSPEHARIVVLDGTPADDPQADVLPSLVTRLPHPAQLVPWRDIPTTIDEIATEVQRRHDENLTNAPAIFLFVHGIQRFRMLRKSEDDFGGSSFSFDDDAPKKKVAKPDKQFATILRDGSTVGVHAVIWCDTYTTLERTLDRQAMKEFDNRVLFQMSANDSSNLIDSAAAATLGFHRALFANDERGILEKFRPYGIPEKHWLDEALAALSKKGAGVVAKK